MSILVTVARPGGPSASAPCALVMAVAAVRTTTPGATLRRTLLLARPRTHYVRSKGDSNSDDRKL